MKDIVILILVVCLVLEIWLRRKARISFGKKKQEIQSQLDEMGHQYEELSKEQHALQEDFESAKSSTEKYKKLALEDLLTGLPNRMALTEQMDLTLLNLRQDEQAFVMYIDIDNLKEVNDTIGYTYGDELLIDVSHRLKQILDENDYLARISGDEFLILTQNVENLDEYEDKIKKVQTIFSYPFTLARKEYFVSINIGLCQLNKDGRTTQSVLKNANAAMYEAKELGQNQYCYYNEILEAKLTEQIQRQSEVRTAFEQNEFDLVYHPILSLKQHKVVGLEALLRWNHPTMGTILPIDFLPSLNESGVIVMLGEQMLVKAFHQLVKWKKAGYPDLMLTINLSLRQVVEQDLVELFQMAMEETGVLPKDLVVDISEELLQEKEDIVYVRIRRLLELGVQVSLDHYGIGQCSLALLKELDFSFIKLDASLYHEIEHDSKEKEFVNHLVDLINGLGCNVVYQGVEEASQLEVLETCQCDYVQGFLFSKPLHAEEVETYLQAWM